MRPMVLLRWLLLSVALLAALFPFYWMVNTSLKPIGEVMRSPPGFISPNWSFAAYATVLATRPVLRWFANSLIVALGSTAIALVPSRLCTTVEKSF